MPNGEQFCPYVGLTHYSEDDAPYFFGRDAERELLSANLLASRLTLVYGPSGVGKSSVLRAGVAHHLKAAARRNLRDRGSAEYAITVFNTWRDDPVASLLHTIARDVEELTGKSTPISDAPFTESLAALAAAAGGELLIILDQFEEYFLYHPDDDGPGTFAWEFPKALAADLPVGFLVSIREDSLARLDRFKGRINQLFDNYLRIDNLDERAARAAIVLPLREYNRRHGRHGNLVAIEHSLVKQVIQDVSAGSLQIGDPTGGTVPQTPARARIETPYLQLIMMRLWDREHSDRSRVLRLRTLVDLGSAGQIVRTHLDTALSALSEEERDTAAEIFRYLVTPSRTKIAHTMVDLAEFAKVERPKLQELLEKLSSGSHRILCPVAPAPDQPSNLRYQIFHDVLAAGIVEWRRSREEKRALEAAAHREQEQRERAEREARSAQRFRVLAAGLAIAFVFMIVVAAYAVSQRNAARKAQKLAEQRDVEKLALADRAEQQRLLAEAERRQKLGFESDAKQLRAQAEERGQRASAAEQVAKDQGIKVSNAARETEQLRKEAEKLKTDNDGLLKELRSARDEIAALQKTVADLREQLKQAVARKQKEKEDALSAKGGTLGPKGPPSDERPPPAVARAPLALAIGISQYEQPTDPLRWSAEDAQSFGRFLNAGPVEVLVDGEATTAAIRRTLMYLLNQSPRPYLSESPLDQLTVFFSARLMEQDGVYYILPFDAEPQDLRVTAISLNEFAESIGSSRRPVRVIADFYESGSRNKNRLLPVLEALGRSNPSSSALIYGHDDGDDLSRDLHRTLAATLPNILPNRPGATMQELAAEALRRLSPTTGSAKQLDTYGRSFLIYDNNQGSRRPSRLRNLISIPRPSPTASSELLAEGSERALSKLAYPQARLSSVEYEGASRRLLIALENRGNGVIRRALRAFETPVPRQDYETCAADFTAALRIEPGPDRGAMEVKRLFCEGSALLMSHNYVDAVQILRRADISADGFVPNALGMAFLEGREFEQARAMFMRAIRAAPHWAYPMRNLAQSMAIQGNLADASRAYASAIALAPESGALLFDFAEIERQRGDKPSAEKLLRAAIQVSPPNAPSNARFYVALGQLRMAAGQRSEAGAFFQKALAIDPTSTEAFHGMAALARAEGHLDDAAKYWRETIRRAPDHLGANLGLGEILTMQGRFDEAVELYSRALQGNPTSIPLLKAAADAMLQSRRFAAAENLANKLLELRPRDPEALELLGDAQAGEGKLSDARNSYTSALANSPSDRARKSIRAKLEKFRSSQ